MNKLIVLISIFIFAQFNHLIAQSQRFHQKVDHQITVQLDHEKHLLDVAQNIIYHNRSTKDLDTILFQLNANAYQSKSTSFAQELLDNKINSLYFAKQEKLGGYQHFQFSQNGKTLNTTSVDKDNTIIAVILKETCQAGSQIKLHVDYRLKIPYQFSQFGVKNDYYKLKDWYPTPVVYTNDGWQILEYSIAHQPLYEFGKYNVKIKADSNYIIATSGYQMYLYDTLTGERIPQYDSLKMERKDYYMDNIDHFVWVANRNFIIETQSVYKQGERINIRSYLLNDNKETNKIKNQMKYMFRNLSPSLGKSPYREIKIIYDIDKINYESLNSTFGKLIFINPNQKNADYLTFYHINKLWHQPLAGYNSVYDNWTSAGINMYFMTYKYRFSGFNRKSNEFMASLSKRHLTLNYDQKNRNSGISELLHPNNLKPFYLIRMLSDYIGKEKFDLLLNEYREKWKYKHPNVTDFKSFIAKNTKKDINEFFEDAILSDKIMDYGIDDVRQQKDNYLLKIRNRASLRLPIRLVGLKDQEVKIDTIINGFIKTQEITINEQDIDEFILDPNQNSLDCNLNNNRIKTAGLFKKSKKIKLKTYWSHIRAKYNYKNIHPFLGLNKVDGLHLGMVFMTPLIKTGKSLKFIFAPSYAVKSESLVGLHSLSYAWYPANSRFQQIELGYDYKTYHFQDFESLIKPDLYFRLRFHRIAPYLRMVFKKEDKVYNAITFQSVTVLKDQFIFSNDKDPQIQQSKKQERYDRIKHDYHNNNSYNSYSINTQLEFHKYNTFFDEDHHYLKLSTEFNTDIYYQEKKKISLRLFASGFILNSNRNSRSYFNEFTHGSLSLFSQGYNDYSFDGMYYDRLNQDLEKPVQINRGKAGGFGVALGQPYSTIGQSNNYIVSLNLKSHLPILNPNIPLKLYVDLGMVSQYNSSLDKFENKIHYSSGLEIDIKDGTFEVLIPIINSEEIEMVYKQKGAFYNRISFSVNIDKLNIWKNSLKYHHNNYY